MTEADQSKQQLNHPPNPDEPEGERGPPATFDQRGQQVETQYNIASLGRLIVNFITGSSEQQRDLRNRQIMLQRVHDFWVKGVLDNSLHNEVLIELGMETKPEAVEYPWDMVIQRPDRPNRQLPPGTKTIDVFDQSRGSLLILGEPGSGKTTMLLELARDLIARAEQDPTLPIPVVFNLSSWAETRPPLAGWLLAEITTKYNIPKKIARPWVANDKLLLLLDGLDEVAAQHREACIQAINDFRQEHLVSVAVCSRLADYETLTSHLKLQGAVLLQPLTPEQINAYLDGAGPELTTLRTTLKEDATLQELAQSPLILSIMTLAYSGTSTKDLPRLDTIEARRRHLFDTYIRQMFARRGVDERYSSEETTQWLAWLAQGIRQHGQTVFLIEQLQPSWVATRFWRWVYVLGTRLIFGIPQGLIFGPGFGLNFGLSGGLIDGARFEKSILKSSKERPVRWKFLRNVLIILPWLLLCGLPLLLGDTIPDTGLFGDIIIGLIFGLTFGMSGALVQFRNDKNEPIKKERTYWQSVRSVLGYGFFWGLLGFLSFEEGTEPIFGVTGGILYGASFGLFFGLRETWQSLTNDIRTVEKLIWSFSGALKAGAFGVLIGTIVNLLLLVIVGIGGDELIAIVLSSFLMGSTVTIAVGLGFIGGLAGAGFRRLVNNYITKKTTTDTNNQFWLRNAIVLGLLVGIMSGLASQLVTFGLFFGLTLAFCGAPVGGFICGIFMDSPGQAKTSWPKYSALTGLVIGLIGGLASSAFIGGLIGGLFGIMYGGITSDIIEKKTVPNQGIQLSLRNAIFTGLFFGSIGMLIFGLFGLGEDGGISGVSFGLSIGLLIGLLTALWYGGLDLIQHYILRLILWYNNLTPRNYTSFLDYCVGRIFLRKVGGGYIFIHRYLMEYFALLTEEDIERLATGTK